MVTLVVVDDVVEVVGVDVVETVVDVVVSSGFGV